MSINWEEVQKALYPIKDYEDLCRRFRVSFGYAFVGRIFNFGMSELIEYTRRVLEGDARRRYQEYAGRLVQSMEKLYRSGAEVIDIRDLVRQSETREKLGVLAEQSNMSAVEIVEVLKFLVFWLVPTEKYMSGLVWESDPRREAVKALSSIEVRTNLDLLERGITKDGRKVLAEASGLSEDVVHELVNRADLSRMPWSSKATISNILGAGYNGVAALAGADAEKLFVDFFDYGKKIGKNLKLGNEIENSHRIAKIVPRVLEN